MAPLTLDVNAIRGLTVQYMSLTNCMSELYLLHFIIFEWIAFCMVGNLLREYVNSMSWMVA